jgi:hypothetical protein
MSDQSSDKYLIWWTSQEDCERIIPLDTWPVYIYDELQSRDGRVGCGRLWLSDKLKDAPECVLIEWDSVNNWLCKAADSAGGIVIRSSDVKHVQFLPGFVTTFSMSIPSTKDADQ